MRDFNFFSPYLLEKRNRRQRKLFTIGVSSFILLALISFSALNLNQISKYNNEIAMVQNYMNAQKTKEMMGKYADTTKKIELTKEYYNKAAEASLYVKNSNTISTALLDKLSSVMTQDAVITDLAINSNIVELQYKVRDLTSVAEIEHNLKSLDIFNDVNVSTINNEKSYTAIISCSLKDVDTSEAETDK